MKLSEHLERYRLVLKQLDVSQAALYDLGFMTDADKRRIENFVDDEKARHAARESLPRVSDVRDLLGMAESGRQALCLQRHLPAGAFPARARRSRLRHVRRMPREAARRIFQPARAGDGKTRGELMENAILQLGHAVAWIATPTVLLPLFGTLCLLLWAWRMRSRALS